MTQRRCPVGEEKTESKVKGALQPSAQQSKIKCRIKSIDPLCASIVNQSNHDNDVDVGGHQCVSSNACQRVIPSSKLLLTLGKHTHTHTGKVNRLYSSVVSPSFLLRKVPSTQENPKLNPNTHYKMRPCVRHIAPLWGQEQASLFGNYTKQQKKKCALKKMTTPEGKV